MAAVLAALIALSAGGADETAGDRGLRVTLKPEGKGAPESVPLYTRMIAVVVGIDRYRELGADQYLHQAVKDAKGMASLLEEYYQFDRIITLYDEQATRESLIKVLQGDLVNTKPDDGVLIYFAGHGVTHPTPKGDLGFLVPYDGSLRIDEQYRNISMQQIKTDIAPMIPAKHVLFIADACFGGLMLDTRSAAMEPAHAASYLMAVTREQARQVITAGGKGEMVLDGGPSGHSVFTGRLIEALKQVDDFITARELGVLIQRQVYADAAARGHSQRPQSGEFYGTGDFVFVPDAGKRRTHLAAEIKRIEKDVAELEHQKKEAADRRDVLRLREIESNRLQAENALKQVRLREDAARVQLDRQEQVDLEAQRNASEIARRDRENAERLAALQKQAEQLRSEMARARTESLTPEDAARDLERLDEAMRRLDETFLRELKVQAGTVEAAYRERIEEAGKAPPRDAMFETEADYQARVAAQQRNVQALCDEMAAKTTAVRIQLAGSLADERRTLAEQKSRVASQEFLMGPQDIAFDLDGYDPDRGLFKVSLSRAHVLPLEGKPFTLALSAAWRATVSVPAHEARDYYRHPDLLVPEMTLVLDGATNAQPRGLVFRGPGGSRYVAATLEPAGGTAIDFAWIPAGVFTMGSGEREEGRREDEREHKVVISGGFWMGRYEVTQAQWEFVMGSNPSQVEGANLPVDSVPWEQCQKFLRRLCATANVTALLRAASGAPASAGGGRDGNCPAGYVFRLPSEAEWEFACRAGTATRFCAGDSEADLDRVGWFAGNADGTTHPVGRRSPNGLGLYDTHGNVAEWCLDWYGGYPRWGVAKDPVGARNGAYPVMRGGDCLSPAWACRSAYRGPAKYVGLRLVFGPPMAGNGR